MFSSYGCFSKLLHLTESFNIIIWTGSPSQTICSVIAAVQHYLYTSLYTWMLIEAINLFLEIVKVFSFGKSYATYIFIGWGKVMNKLRIGELLVSAKL